MKTVLAVTLGMQAVLVAALILAPEETARGYAVILSFLTITLLSSRLVAKEHEEPSPEIEKVIEERVQSKTEHLVELVIQYEQQATTDALTGLLNRRGGEDSIQHHIARSQRVKTAISFILVDIDHFKRVNDQFGHAIGDTVISGVAHSLKTTVRTADLAIRWGGEEFLICLPDTDLAGAIVAAEKIRKTLEKIDFGTSEPVTASFGCAELGEDPFNLALARADMNLYIAKSKGRNQVFPQSLQKMLDRS